MTLVSFNIRSRSPRSYHFLKAITMMYLCQLGQNMPNMAISFSFFLGTVSGSGTGPLDYGATGPVPDP